MTTLRSARSFGGYLLGAGSARVGDEMAGPSLLLVGLAATGSESAASLLFAAATAGAAVGGPVFGALLDRSARPGRLLAAALGIYAAGIGLAAAGLGRVPFGAVLAVAAAAGLLAPAVSSGWTSQLPRVVPAASLPRASALDAITYSTAGLVGPALVAVVATVAGPWGAAVGAVALIVLALPFARVVASAGLPAVGGAARPPRFVRPARSARTVGLARSARPVGLGWPARPVRSVRLVRLVRPAVGLAAELGEGLRAVVGGRALARATAVTTLSMAAGGMLAVCWPLLGADLLGAPERGALMPALTAASAIAANALLARRPALLAPDPLIGAASAVLCAVPLVAASAAALPAAAAPAAPAVLAAAALLAGAAEGPQLTALFAVRHRDAPARVRARVFAIGAGLKVSGLAAGAAIAGPLAERGTEAVLLAAAGTEALAVAVFCASALLPPRGPATARNGRRTR